eukprot:7463411-Ditylum_brightwellii.AAC.1
MIVKLATASVFVFLFHFARAVPQTLEIIGTERPPCSNTIVGEDDCIDLYAEVSHVDPSSASGPVWGPTYSVGTHPWQGDLPGPIKKRDGTDANWVNGYPSDEEGLNTIQWLRIRFILPDDYDETATDIIMRADNQGILTVNGHSLGTFSGGERWEEGETAGLLQPGLNVILMTLIDTGGLVAFQYRILATFDGSHGGTLIEAASPTQAPSALPTFLPSSLPTLSPSVLPTFLPSSLPTLSPSALPT